MTRDVVVVPSTLALLPSYAGVDDPVAGLRSACRDATSWLVKRSPDRILVLTVGPRPDNVARGVGEPAGARIGRQLLAEAGFAGEVEVTVAAAGTVASDAPGWLVVANGSARRSEKAPGHLDERSFGFDAAIQAALADGDPERLRRLDDHLGAELWAYDVPALQAMGDAVGDVLEGVVTYSDDPYGVQYWVVRWSCAS